MEFTSPSPCPNTVTARRNPPRKARATPSTAAAIPASLSSTSTKLRDIPSFPLEEVLGSGEVPQIPPIAPSEPSEENGSSQNLRVFLRIRPLDETKPKNGGNGDRQRVKGVLHRKETTAKNKKKKNEMCLVVNDCHSVALSPPPSLQDSKRIKTEIYDGFSHVFGPDSLQKEVYERVMEPLVSDFIKGRSGMLVAMGPTGSGKTHTVFGCPREPGIIPLTLRRILGQNDESSEVPRSYYISMFEIYNERGKGEKIFDLSSDGSHLFLQQSTIKGLQEVMVSDVTQAECVIALGMLKRATAMTNANSQSSRSQCIINIRSSPKMIDGDVEVQPNNAVLTIVDLAGAEREKKTGNQGSRLLESNFINNTSMVFGLCLRSLLEHQKNPKKQLQKHFQNSLLTRYLRDYLEGKKRMTLILTTKPGEDDYLDTSYLLRQASPYMKIRFNNVEEPCQKRRIHTLTRIEQPKRRKLSNLDASAIDEGESAKDEHIILEKEVISEQLQELEPLRVSVSSPRPLKLELSDNEVLKEEYHIELERRERNDRILQDFSKALWNVLKQYKKKFEASENEVRILKESLRKEKIQYFELEKELKDLKSCCPCYTQNSTEASSALKVGMDADFGATGLVQLEQHASNNIHEECSDACSPNLKVSECNNILKLCDTIVQKSPEMSLQCINQKRNSMPGNEINGEDSEQLRYLEGKDNSSNGDVTETGLRDSESMVSSSQSQALVGGDDSSPMEQKKMLSEEKKVPISQPKHKSSTSNPLNVEKPRRRLRPVSSILLKEISGLGLEDDNEKPKGSKGGVAAEERARTQGSISLLKLLRKNQPL